MDSDDGKCGLTAGGARARDPGLYLVATPIGAARDVTLRALDVLGAADLVAAEDTRQARKLLDIHGVRRDPRTILPYHDHNGAAQRPRLLAALAEGRSVALVSDAGTPLVADPGYRLAVEAIAAGSRGARGAGGLGAAGGAVGGGPAERPVPVRGLPAAEGRGAAAQPRRAGRRAGDAGLLREPAPAGREPRRDGGDAGRGPAGGGLPGADQALRGGASRDAGRAGRGAWRPVARRKARSSSSSDRRSRARPRPRMSTPRFGRRWRSARSRMRRRRSRRTLGMPRREVYARALDLAKADGD